MTEPMRFLALGAGVQSSTVLMLTLAGELPPVAAAIFADTGWEPPAVYAHLAAMEARCADAGLPLVRVKDGDIRDFTRKPGTGAPWDAPFYLHRADGSIGPATRQCTRALKIRPMRREIRRRMAAAGARRAVQVFGISADEFHRMRQPDVGYLDHDYPLVEMRWTRATCIAYLAERGVVAPRSACIGCPFHSDAEWRAIRARPDEWAEAVEWERRVQAERLAGSGMTGVPFVHRSGVPLEDVDLSTPEDHGQLALGFGDECAGVCGV